MASSNNAVPDRSQSQQNAGMAAITIRDVPDETRDLLAARAARSGRSLQEFLRLHLIELAGKPPMEEVLERVRQRKLATGTTFPAEEILELRDLDRR
ncbi:MAG: FitA-like ribbon-helix-helix domain-containing protein [Aquihabitans sp.]